MGALMGLITMLCTLQQSAGQYQGRQGSSQLLIVALLVPQVLQQGRTVVTLLPCKPPGACQTCSAAAEACQVRHNGRGCQKL